MKFVKEKDGDINIYVDAHEEEVVTIYAFVQSSFDMARKSNAPMSPQAKKELDKIIMNIMFMDINSTVEVNCIDGYICNTHIRKLADKHFAINTSLFEKSRTDLTGVIERTQSLITPCKFKGGELDEIVAPYGFKRNPDECGWDFRRRVFVDFYLKSRSVKAYEFLVGAEVDDFGEVEELGFMMLISGSQDRDTLTKFAYEFNIDPLELRERRAAGEDI
ncbi:MAG: hypothetical protein WCL02_09935 [bacterium]